MMGEQRAFIEHLATLAPDAQLYVAGEWKGAPSRPVPWQDWPWDEQDCSFRSLLPNEVLFDFDQPLWDDVVRSAREVEQRLGSVGCPSYQYNTGGKGWHLHVFLNSLGVDAVASWKQIRLRFWEWATHMGGISDRVKIGWSSYSVVRAEGALRRPRPRSLDDLFSPPRGVVKAYHEAIPPTRPQPTEARYPDRLLTFELPVPFLLTIMNENGLGDCPNCEVPLSEQHVSYDDWDDRVESVVCAICRARQLTLKDRYPLEGEWRHALPAGWLPG